MKPTRTATKVVGLSVVAVVGAIMLVEATLEPIRGVVFTFDNELHPFVEFRFPAHLAWTSDEPSSTSRIGALPSTYTNEDGLRIPGPEYDLARTKPSGVVRVGILGGSTVAIGTTFQESLPGALQALLDHFHPNRFEVINGGIVSANSRQELIQLLTTIVDYEPDVVVIYDGINDSGHMLYYEERPNYPYNYHVIERAWRQYVSERRDPVWRVLADRSAVLQRIWPEKFGGLRTRDPVPADALIDDPNLRSVYAAAHIDNWERMKRVCDAYGIRPVFVLQPIAVCRVFADGQRRDDQRDPIYDRPYAQYLVYEHLRANAAAFAARHPRVTVADLSSSLAEHDFLDGAHLYDDAQPTIARNLYEIMGPMLGALVGAAERGGMR